MIEAEQLEVIVINTVAVLTSMPEKKAEWREVIAGAWQRAEHYGAEEEHVFLSVLLAHIDGAPVPELPPESPYREALARVEAGLASGGVEAPPLPPEVLQALNALLTSETWADARRVLEEQQAVLLQPLVEETLDQLAERAVNDGKPELAENFALHRDLLRAAREEGIPQAFAALGLADDPYADLAARAAAGLGGGPAERMALAQYVAARLPAVEDPAERSLLETIQMAVFSKHPAQVKHKLEGKPAQVWEEIVQKIEKSA